MVIIIIIIIHIKVVIIIIMITKIRRTQNVKYFHFYIVNTTCPYFHTSDSVKDYSLEARQRCQCDAESGCLCVGEKSGYKGNISLIIRISAFCICENEDADQLHIKLRS